MQKTAAGSETTEPAAWDAIEFEGCFRIRPGMRSD